MDFMDDAAPDALIDALGSAPDLVISDMAANTVGHPQTDHLRTIALAETAADFAVQTLQIGRAHICTPVTNAHLVCRLLLETKNNTTFIKSQSLIYLPTSTIPKII